MKIVWNYSALFSSSIRTLSLSTKQGLLILKKARVAQPQKSKSWIKGYNKESNKTFNKTFYKTFNNPIFTIFIFIVVHNDIDIISRGMIKRF